MSSNKKRAAARYEAKREDLIAYQRAYNQANKQRAKERLLASTTPEERRKKKRDYYLANRPRILAKANARYAVLRFSLQLTTDH
jgi:hypothetical protein